MKKTIILFLFVAVMLFVAVACGTDEAPKTTAAVTTSAPITTVTVKNTTAKTSSETTAPAVDTTSVALTTESVAPIETTTPNATETPAVTTTPKATETPAVTTTPKVTETPAVTTTPKVTEIPAVTTTPKVTETPAVTTTPKATEKPAVTTAPIVTTPKAPETEPAPITYTAANWMGALPDATRLNNIALPGTHDSGAMHDMIISGTAKCQSLTIAEQLNVGVRFLDIRLGRVNGELKVYHGDVDQKLSFDEVLSACYAFLDQNPSETVIVCIKEERSAEGTNDAFETMVAAKINANKTKWYTSGGTPKLSAIRGKIVLMRRYGDANNSGINASSGWSDNTSFTLNAGSCTLNVQDYYQVSSGDDKWSAVSSQFEKMTYQPSTYYMNFTSGYVPGLFSIPSITKVSSAVNPKLIDYLKTNPDFVGIVVTDFVTEEIAKLIYEVNFS